MNMNSAQEIEEAIDSAASSIMKAMGLIGGNDDSQARRSLVLARIDLEFAVGVTHLMVKLEEDVGSAKERGKALGSIGSVAGLGRIKGWLEEAKSSMLMEQYQEVEVLLVAAVRVLESNLKALERRPGKNMVGESSRVASSSGS